MAAKGTRLRFELGRLEVAGVVVSTAAGLFVVFLLGIYAGRGMAERRLELDEQMVRIPVDTEQAATQENELTFYETLAGDEDPTPKAQADAEPRDQMKETVSGSLIAEEDLPARDEAPAAKPAPKVVAKARPEPKPEPKAKPKSEPKAKAQPAPKPELKDEPIVAVALVDEEPAAAPPKATGGDWSVQVAATRDPRHAESIKRQLTAKGYRAYIVQTRRQGETFHRVRVGRYPSMDEARQVASLLRNQPGVTGAFVASD